MSKVSKNALQKHAPEDVNNIVDETSATSSILQIQRNELMKRLSTIDTKKLKLTNFGLETGKAFWDSPNWNSNWNSNWDSNWHSNSNSAT